MPHENRPKVGIGVLVFNEAGDILLGKRRNSHGASTWSPPGGHLEFGESFESCALRELQEETLIRAESATFIGITNDIFSEEQKHYVSILMKVQCPIGQLPQLGEPEKTLEWQWFSLHKLPEPLFLPLANLVKQYNLHDLNALCKY